MLATDLKFYFSGGVVFDIVSWTSIFIDIVSLDQSPIFFLSYFS